MFMFSSVSYCAPRLCAACSRHENVEDIWRRIYYFVDKKYWNLISASCELRVVPLTGVTQHVTNDCSYLLLTVHSKLFHRFLSLARSLYITQYTLCSTQRAVGLPVDSSYFTGLALLQCSMRIHDLTKEEADHDERAYNGGPGSKSPAGSRGRDPCEW